VAVTFGLAVENFTPMSSEPDAERLVAYATRAEALGLSSLWVWDHLFLGARRAFPFFESLTTLTMLAEHTRTLTLGTGVLVLPIRDPVLLAKTTGTIQIISKGRLSLGMAAGWYEREFEATGVPFKGRGRVFERNLEILRKLWEEDMVTGNWDELALRSVRMLPRPVPPPQVLIGGYVDRVLHRVATKSDGWLTYFYTAESFGRAWQKIRAFAEAAGRDPDELKNVAQLPFCVADSYESADRSVRQFLDDYFDVAPWSESTPESSIRGTPEQCAEQLSEHVAVGTQHIVLVPYNYELDQVDRFAAEVLPKLDQATTGSGT